MNDLQTVVISIDNPTPEALDQLSELMAVVQDEMTEYIQKLAVELNVPEACAMDVYYLRTRSRWMPELEAELIQLHQQGTPPNMCEFGCKSCGK